MVELGFEPGSLALKSALNLITVLLLSKLCVCFFPPTGNTDFIKYNFGKPVGPIALAAKHCGQTATCWVQADRALFPHPAPSQTPGV